MYGDMLTDVMNDLARVMTEFDVDEWKHYPVAQGMRNNRGKQINTYCWLNINSGLQDSNVGRDWTPTRGASYISGVFHLFI